MLRVPLIIEPDEDDPDCATVFVDVTIGGRPYRFVLDTGAARTQVVADDFLLSLPSQAKHRSSGVFGTREQNVVELPELTVGSLVVPGLAAVCQSGGKNLLGMDVIGAHACRFDFVRSVWELAGPGTLPTRWLLDRSRRGHGFVDVVWSGVTARACWDSGAGITIVDSTFLGRHPDLFEFVGMSTGTDSTGAQVSGPMYLMRAARTGDRMFAAHRVAVVDLPRHSATMDLILGYPALRQATWILDFPRSRWGFA